MRLLFTLVFTNGVLAAAFPQAKPDFNRKDRDIAGLKGPVKSVTGTGYEGDRKTQVIKSAATPHIGWARTYNTSGNLLTASESGVQKKYTYNTKGRLIRIKQTSGKLNENYRDSIVWKEHTEYHYFRNAAWPDKKLVLTRYIVCDSLDRPIREYGVNKEKEHHLGSSWNYRGKNMTEEAMYSGGKLRSKIQWDYTEFDSISEYRKYDQDSSLHYFIRYEYNALKLKTKELCYNGKTNELVEIREFTYNDRKQLVKAFYNRLYSINLTNSTKEFFYDANGFLVRYTYSLQGGTRRIDQVETYVNDKYGNPLKVEKFENDIKHMIVEAKYTYY